MTTLFLAIILAAVTATATPATATPAAASCPIITVIVRRGDTLGIIAGRYLGFLRFAATLIWLR